MSDDTPRTIKALSETEQKALLQGIRDDTISLEEMCCDRIPDQVHDFTYRDWYFIYSMNENNKRRNEKIAQLEMRCEQLDRRLDLLALRAEENKGVHYAGVHQVGHPYREGALVTKAGSLWCARRATSSTPGRGPSDWQLVAKNGGFSGNRPDAEDAEAAAS
jgi:hypothetical protein